MSRRSRAPGAETLAGVIVCVISALVTALLTLATRQVAHWWFYRKLGGIFGVSPRTTRAMMKRIAE